MHGFEKPGEQNTDGVLKHVRERGGALGIKTCLVATTRGKTALAASKVLEGFDIIAVTHCTGFTRPDFQELADETRGQIEAMGIKVLTATHAFGTIGRAIRKKFKTVQVDEIVANVLRRFGEGTKVAVEIAMMAADAGLVRTDADVISVGGTGLGADTAIILRPVNSHALFDLRIREIICKPFDF